jgi:hypothetical protein
MKKKLSVFIVPDSGEVRQFSISRTVLITVISAIFTYAIVTVFFSYGFFSSRIEAHKIDSLTKENQFLTAKRSIRRINLTSTNRNSLPTEKEKAIRTILNCGKSNHNSELGIGPISSAGGTCPSISFAFQSEAEDTSFSAGQFRRTIQ